MKICRFEQGGTLRLGAIEGEHVRDLSGTLHEDLFRATPEQIATLQAAVDDAPRLKLAEVNLQMPIGRPGTVFAVGLNYRHHAIEQGKDIPTEPTVFIKPPAALGGPYDPIHPNPASPTLDYEGEIVAVIGTACAHVGEAEAARAISGWCLINDVSVRDFVKPNSLPVGKGGRGHGPVGPWITTADEIIDPTALHVRTSVNGEVRQDSPASDMIFTAAKVIAFLSQGIALKPGNMVALGSPGGSGIGFKPPRWLVPGDVVRVDCPQLGYLENRVAGG